MAAVNLVVLTGRWTRRPDLRYSPEGIGVALATLAVDRPPRKDGEKAGTDFLRVVVFGKTAEAVATHTDKGSRVLVLGRLRQRRYEARDGSRREVYEVVASRVVFMDAPGNGNGAKSGKSSADDLLGGILDGDLGEDLEALDGAADSFA